MNINIRTDGKAIDGFKPGYGECPGYNRRYYTKAEVDELLEGIIDKTKIQEIVNNIFTDYITDSGLEELIISTLAGYYTNEEIDNIIAAFETRVGEKYITDFNLTINGTIFHNNDNVVIDSEGEAADLNSKTDVSAFTEFQETMEDCCDNAHIELGRLKDYIDELQEMLDNYNPDTGSTPDTGGTDGEYVTFIFNILSTTEPAWIAEDSIYPHYDKMIIDDGDVEDFTPRYTFSTPGIHKVRLRLIHPDNMDRANEIVLAGSLHTGFTHCYLIAYYVPSSVKSMSLHMQSRNDMVKKITLFSATPPTLLDTFGYNYAWCFNGQSLFYVPAESVEDYKTANGWSKVADRIHPIN